MPTMEARWLSRFNGGEHTFAPTFTLYYPDDGAQYVGRLREAFAFLRRHGDRRYSARSLMNLLSTADTVEALTESGRVLDTRALPVVLVAETPFTYDEETEVKSGGIAAVAVKYPDGKTMVGVHQTRRRARVGMACVRMLGDYLPGPVVLWVHNTNTVGQQFCLSLGLTPRSMNPSGAMAYSATYFEEEESMAVEMCDDYELDRALSNTGIAGGRPRRRTPRAIPEPPRYYDDDDGCEESVPQAWDREEANERFYAALDAPMPARDEIGFLRLTASMRQGNMTLADSTF